ncbi:hypothetical protein LINGRAHAP2_LOCUS14101 [Linum grandiflorum]
MMILAHILFPSSRSLVGVSRDTEILCFGAM